MSTLILIAFSAEIFDPATFDPAIFDDPIFDITYRVASVIRTSESFPSADLNPLFRGTNRLTVTPSGPGTTLNSPPIILARCRIPSIPKREERGEERGDEEGAEDE